MYKMSFAEYSRFKAMCPAASGSLRSVADIQPRITVGLGSSSTNERSNLL